MEPRRARRRRHTRRIAKQRRSDHRKRIYGDPADWTAPLSRRFHICYQADTYFAKVASLGCQLCRTHRRGRPRVEGGMCKAGRRTRVYRWRNQARELNLAFRFGLDPDSDAGAALASPHSLKTKDY